MYAQESFSPDPVHVNANRVVRNGVPLFEITAIGFVRATPEQAWSVLTDYERLADFVPDLVSARLLSRSGNVARVENRSNASFLFLSQVIRVVLQIEEDPYSTIDVALVEGDMKRYDTHWDLEPMDVHGECGTRITFSGELEPDFPVPLLLGRSILQSSLRKTLEAVVAEVNRHNMH